MTAQAGILPTNQRGSSPILSGPGVVLRELTACDAPFLLAHLGNPAVLQHITAPPPSRDAFLEFIHWTHEQRRLGRHFCLGIVPTGIEHAVGIIQVWPLESRFATAEWGFAIGADYWGTGLFPVAAETLFPFVFGALGVGRLEARSAIRNVRANGVLKKLGATREGILRGGSSSQNHVMWSLLAEEWRERRQASVSASPTAVNHGG